MFLTFSNILFQQLKMTSGPKQPFVTHKNFTTFLTGTLLNPWCIQFSTWYGDVSPMDRLAPGKYTLWTVNPKDCKNGIYLCNGRRALILFRSSNHRLTIIIKIYMFKIFFTTKDFFSILAKNGESTWKNNTLCYTSHYKSPQNTSAQ